MNKRYALTLYLASAALYVAAIFGLTRVGWPLWAAFPAAFLVFVLANGSLAYAVAARRLKLDGKGAPPYRQFLVLFLRSLIPEFREEAPRSAHLWVGVAAALIGSFLLFCSVALLYDAEWSYIPHPLIVAAICLVPAAIGGIFMYLARRLFAFRPRKAQ